MRFAAVGDLRRHDHRGERAQALDDFACFLDPSEMRVARREQAIRLDESRLFLDCQAEVRLSPRVRTGWALHLYGAAHLIERRFHEAVPHLRLAVEEEPAFIEPYRLLAACCAHLGRIDEAREVVERLRSFTPLVVPPQIPYRREAHREVYFSGLRLAAGEAA